VFGLNKSMERQVNGAIRRKLGVDFYDASQVITTYEHGYFDLSLPVNSQSALGITSQSTEFKGLLLAEVARTERVNFVELYELGI
jgi:hypothetical protein